MLIPVVLVVADIDSELVSIPGVVAEVVLLVVAEGALVVVTETVLVVITGVVIVVVAEVANVNVRI